MIERYTLPEMGRVWSEAHKYELWCRIETLVLAAHAAGGVVPAEVVDPVRAAAPPTPQAVAEIEVQTQHDVIAFLSAWADNTDPRSAAAYVRASVLPEMQKSGFGRIVKFGSEAGVAIVPGLAAY